MRKLIGIRFHSALFLFATLILLAATAAGFRFQTPLVDAKRYNLSDVSCWLNPCTIDGLPTFPWERHGAVSLANHVGAFSVSRTGLILLAFSDHRVVSWDEDYQTEIAVSLSADSPITAVTCQRRRDYAPERRSKSAPRASAVACPRSPREGPARGATRPPRGWRRPARGRGLWAHGGKRGYSDGRWRCDRLCLSL